MKKFFKVTTEIIADALHNIAYFISSNLKNFAVFLGLLLPYAMYFIGQHSYSVKGKMCVGYELIIPVAIYIVICFMKSYANRIGKGTTIPIPTKRFTEIDDDEVTIDQNRLQEIILYLADLENWLERKGLLR